MFFFPLVASTSLGIVLSKHWKFSSSCPCIVGSIHYMVKDLDPTVDVEYFSFCEALCLRNACIHLAGNHIYMLPWAVPFSFLFFFYLLFFYAKHMLHCLLADNNLSRGRSAKTLKFWIFQTYHWCDQRLTSLYAPSLSVPLGWFPLFLLKQRLASSSCSGWQGESNSTSNVREARAGCVQVQHGNSIRCIASR